MMKMAEWRFPTEVMFMGYNRTGYNGAFPDNVEKAIRGIVRKPCLNLFSGVSKIGDERIDLSRPEATKNMDVFDFIKENRKEWEWCILDPPYNVHNPNSEQKNRNYSDFTAISCSPPKRKALADFFRRYCKNVVWFDFCAPLPPGFRRKKVWFFFPGGYRTLRVLSWLQRNGRRLDEFVVHEPEVGGVICGS